MLSVILVLVSGVNGHERTDADCYQGQDKPLESREGIIRANYELLKDDFQRDSCCTVRGLTASELGKRITQEEFDWFLTDQGYSIYRDDVWISIEQKEGLQRP